MLPALSQTPWQVWRGTPPFLFLYAPPPPFPLTQNPVSAPLSLHANGALPGAVPSEWLFEQNLFVCPHCYQLVANSRHSTHLQQSTQSQIANISSHSLLSIQDLQTNQELPTFAKVCQLNHPTLRFVPAKARPAFARALSSTLKDILLHNTEESWLKLFMLPKCVLPSLKQKGVTNPHPSIEFLCKLWLDNDLEDPLGNGKTQGQ